MSVRITRRVAAAAALLTLSLLAPRSSEAQSVYGQNQLDVPTKVASTEMTSRLLARSYPPALKRAGVTGTVNLEFVVDTTGKVEAASVKVVDSTSPELAAAAKSVVPDLKFKPGRVKGQAVRSTVSLPIVYN